MIPPIGPDAEKHLWRESENKEKWRGESSLRHFLFVRFII